MTQGLPQALGHAIQSLAEARTDGQGSHDMHVLLSTYGSRGDVESSVGRAVQVRARGAAALVDAVAAAAETGAALVAEGG